MATLMDPKKFNDFSRALARTREAKICVSIIDAVPDRSVAGCRQTFEAPQAQHQNPKMHTADLVQCDDGKVTWG
jgi:hypothetical protein